MKKSELLIYISIVLCVIFTILSAFTCYRSGMIFSGIHDPMMEGAISWSDERNNAFFLMLMLCVFEIFVLIPGERYYLLWIKVVVSVIRMFITTMMFLLHITGGAVFERMGGLGSSIAEVTVSGYIALVLSWLILFTDIVLVKVKHREIEQRFCY